MACNPFALASCRREASRTGHAADVNRQFVQLAAISKRYGVFGDLFLLSDRVDAGKQLLRERGYSVPRAQQTAERLRRCATVQLMRVGPSEPACRSRFQTTFGGFVQKARS